MCVRRAGFGLPRGDRSGEGLAPPGRLPRWAGRPSRIRPRRAIRGRPGTVRAVPDITGLDETAYERLLNLRDYSTELHGRFIADPDPVFGPIPISRQVVVTPEGGDPVAGELINPRVVVDHDDDSQTTVVLVGEVPQEFADRLKRAARKGRDSDD